CPPATPDLDWAVLRLDMPAVGVSPYAVEASPAKGLKEHAKVTFVAHSMDFWRKDASGNKIFPKHIQKDCEIQKVYSSFEPIYYGADCDAASFASGGSLLNELPNGQVILSGILKGGPGTEEQDEQSRETGEKLMGPYADRTYAGYYIPVAGDFLRAINKAAE
ncbi:MAG: hypothetical protein ACXVA9_09150, partial [Bdellovibrionales bacterium]